MLERTVTNHALGTIITLSLDLGDALVFDAQGRLVEKELVHG